MLLPAGVSSNAMASDWASITKQLNDNQNRCLEQSYRITSTQTPAKIAAAEMAFQVHFRRTTLCIGA
jgi:hypothetical protein